MMQSLQAERGNIRNGKLLDIFYTFCLNTLMICVLRPKMVSKDILDYIGDFQSKSDMGRKVPGKNTRTSVSIICKI